MSTLALRPVLADQLVKRFSTATNVIMVGVGALIVGLLAQVSIPLWPVPITGQTLGVMLVGASLGARRGAMSMLTYMVLGLVGVPWFSQFSGGLAAVLKPSFGYIIGFIPAAFVIGYLSEKQWDRRPLLALAAFGVASLIPFVTGIPYLWAVLAFAGKNIGFMGAIGAGFTPFIVGGIVKWLIAAATLPVAWNAVHHFDESSSS